MLVLSRRVGERLVIGDDIVLTVIEVRSDGVRLGIDAPRHVRVHRAEILDAVKAANVEASAVDDDAVAQLRELVRPRTAPAGPAAEPAAGPGAAPAAAPQPPSA
ncbi:carbon storage regulator CsrA [Cellulomonas sp. P22]|uniref:carbon storage regulator CsrA n=1 Tax=Cellulomonas sp. P22 TaxID=3373189 RepID=UPI00379D35CF